MEPQLILFTGSSPGAGKSTLSRLLFEQFTAHHIAAHWLHEEAITETFERFVPEISTGAITPERLLQASGALVEACGAEDMTWIIDSYLPGFYYLYGRYTDEQIAAFSITLQSILSPLQPLIIYLKSDVKTAFMRGAQQRGIVWLENLTRYLNGWELPHYGSSNIKPLRTTADVIEFFSRADQLAVTLLESWPDALILDTTDTRPGQLLTLILRHLQLTERPIDRYVTSDELRRYTGVYMPDDGEPESEPLQITLVGNALFVNTYWPAGARLIPEGNARFRLESTNRYITFADRAQGQVYGLTYSYSKVAKRYKKRG